MSLHWSLEKFTQLYHSLENDTPDPALVKEVNADLINLTKVPKKNQQSRQTLEKGTVTFQGVGYELNQEFKIAAATLSDELDIDELVAAELIYSSEGKENGLIENAKANFYLRKQTILSIVSYFVNSPKNASFLNTLSSVSLINSLLESFQAVEEELSSIHSLVSRAKLLGQYSNNNDLQLKITFRRDFLKNEHETLGEIFYGLVSNKLIPKAEFLKFLNFASSFDVDDFFALHLLPGFLLFVSQLNNLKEEDVKQLHSDLLKELRSTDIYRVPLKLLVILAFCSHFIEWCKSSTQRLKEFDFEIAIETPMTTAVQLGALEQLLIISAETSITKFDLFYDIRSLLEQHLPRLVPKRILDVNEEETKKVNSSDPQSNTTVYVINKEYELSDNLSQLLTQTLHTFIQCFISDAAFLLVKIKDSEEDSLLSGEDFSLDEISKNADLERFYLSIYYIYADRSSTAQYFWDDRDSNAYGFIEWASKSEDLLMRSTFILMISALASGAENAVHVYHFIASSDKLSWSSIIDFLASYVEKIAQYEQNGDDKYLSEETILSISSYLTLIYRVSIESETVKGLFDETLLLTLFNLLNLDTPLVGAVLHVLRSLVSSEDDRRNLIWERLDSWLLSQPLNTLKETVQSHLITFPDIVGFVDLVEALISKPQSSIGKLSIPYPIKLGYPYRKPGIAPYLEFLLGDIFYHSPSLFFSEKVALQEPILKIIQSCLSSFDADLILNSFPAGVDLNAIVSTQDFTTFVQANPAPIVLNFLFQEKIYTTLLDIVSTGFDNISDKPFEEKQVQVVDLSLNTITQILDLEVAYIDELLPILKKQNNFEFPGTHGLRSFYDAILFNLPVVAHIALYVGSTHLPIADKSIKILTRFASSPQFGANFSSNASSSGKTRLLTIIDSINESLRIKQNFIDQLESEIDSTENLELKIQILNFINSNLSTSSKSITVSHFILGFDIKSGLTLGRTEDDTFIASNTSVFKTLLFILESSFLSISRRNIDYAPTRLISLVMEIILKLSKNPLSSPLILEYVSKYDLLLKVVDTPQVDSNTLWSGVRLNPTDVLKSSTGPSIGALLSLLSQRSFIFQYLSLELHRTATQGTLSQISEYIGSLISGNDAFLGPPKVLSFLDILEFAIGELPSIPDTLKYFGNVDLNIDLNKVGLADSCDGSVFDLEILNSLLDLNLRQLSINGTYRTKKEEETQIEQIDEVRNDLKRTESKVSSLVQLPLVVKSNEGEVLNEKSFVIHKYVDYLSTIKFKSYQLSALHSWVQLIQVIITDGNLDQIKRSNFILEVFQIIVPRIDDYIERDILYAEELVSLCVSLYDIYYEDRKSIEDGDPDVRDGYERLFLLFRSCVNGILSPSSSLSLRSDLYVLSNKYLTWVSKDQEVSKEIVKSIKLSGDRLISVITNDAINGEGPARITGLLLLESLFQLSNVNQLNLVLTALAKNNLLLLLVKSIKRTDQTLSLAHTNSKITLDSLLYEFTAFKATLSLLTRIAETGQGAQQLLQSEIFQTIKSCSLFLIDPDIGLNLTFDESTVQSSSFVRVNLNLDTPLSFDNNTNAISLFELLVPTFQLVTAILLSTSSENRPIIQQVKGLLKHFRRLIVGVLKRDVLVESKNSLYKDDDIKGSGLRDLVNLFVLLSTLTQFNGEE